MINFYFDICCSELTAGSFLNFQARELERHPHLTPFSHFLTNIVQAVSLGVIIDAALSSFKLNKSPAFYFLVTQGILSVVVLSTSGLSYLARKTNHFSQEVEFIERNLGKFMNILGRISSVATLILFAPHAAKAPVHFGFAAAAVGLNIIASLC